MADEKAEAYDNKSHGERCHYLQYEVGTIVVEPFAHLRHFRQEDEVEQVDVESTYTDVLQRATNDFVAGEPFLIIIEEDEHHREQGEHCHGARQVGPCKLQGVPAEDVGTAYECHYGQQGEEPRQDVQP